MKFLKSLKEFLLKPFKKILKDEIEKEYQEKMREENQKVLTKRFSSSLYGKLQSMILDVEMINRMSSNERLSIYRYDGKGEKHRINIYNHFMSDHVEIEAYFINEYYSNNEIIFFFEFKKNKYILTISFKDIVTKIKTSMVTIIFSSEVEVIHHEYSDQLFTLNYSYFFNTLSSYINTDKIVDILRGLNDNFLENLSLFN